MVNGWVVSARSFHPTSRLPSWLHHTLCSMVGCGGGTWWDEVGPLSNGLACNVSAVLGRALGMKRFPSSSALKAADKRQQ